MLARPGSHRGHRPRRRHRRPARRLGGAGHGRDQPGAHEPVKAKSLVDEGARGARTLARLVENPAGFLNPILLLVLICQLVSATLVGIVAVDVFGGFGVLVGIVFEVVVIFVFFEAVPKNWAVPTPNGRRCSARPW